MKGNGFDNDEIKEILYYILTIWILILSILLYLNMCTATDQVDCVYMNKDLSQHRYKIYPLNNTFLF